MQYRQQGMNKSNYIIHKNKIILAAAEFLELDF